LSLIYEAKVEEDRKTMQHQSKALMFLSTLWNFCRFLAILWLCVFALTVISRACEQKSYVNPWLSAAAAGPAKKGTAPNGPAKPASAQVQDPIPFIPATQAFEAPGCSASRLGGITIDILNIGTIGPIPSPERLNPEWKAITVDPSLAPNQQPPQIVEGFVGPTENHSADTQATAEVSEEEIAWNHHTHDWTFKLTPDPAYQHFLSSWARFPGKFESSQSVPPDQNGCPANFIFVLVDPDNPNSGTCIGCPGGDVLTGDLRCQIVAPETCPGNQTGDTCHHTDMEVEWENAALMDAHDQEGFARDFGAVPEFVWPSVGDRVWVEGRWIFDCGHPGTPDADPDNPQFVKFGSELHPPRALVTFRANRVTLDSFPRPRISEPNFPFPQSRLPVTGDFVILPPDVPNSGPTQVPVTEADMYVSVDAGAAGDLCSIVPVPCSAQGGHTGSFIPVNDHNYMFDVYPPGTDFTQPNPDGTFPVTPPVPDASLQWRFQDHFSELPARACGGTDNTVCATVQPIICLIGASTPPPPRDAVQQTNAGLACPALQNGEKPTRLRVILPFNGSNANFFAQTLLLGWDDVPTPGHGNVRTFEVRLHEFKFIEDGQTTDWREFVSVGGQWRYVTPYIDTDKGIFPFDGGENQCDVGIIERLEGHQCFNYDNTPWTISVKDGEKIHVSVGGFAARGLEHHDSPLFLCQGLDGCDPPSDFDDKAAGFIALATDNDDRIGTYEFDLIPNDYQAPPPHTTDEFGCQIHTGLSRCNLQYRVTFSVKEITPTAVPPASNPIQVGTPHFGNFITSATPVTLSSSSPDAEGFQYRSYLSGGPLPVYPFPSVTFPVHWAHVDLPAGSQSVPVFLTGTDGDNLLQFSAQSFANLLEPRNTQHLSLDNTPPVINIIQPQPTTYTHNATLTLNYSADDGTGSGVASVTATMDGRTSLPGGVGLQNGQQIRLLKELLLGSHTFTVAAADNLNNTGTASVTFTIVVTPASIIDDVTQFVNDGSIDNHGIANSLTVKLQHAADARAGGNCSLAANLYGAFINEVQAQSGKHVSADAAAILIADAQFLIANCP
jgi:hypothetical protein